MNSTNISDYGTPLTLLDDICIFFAVLFGFYGILYACSKMYITRKRSRSISDSDQV